MKKYTKKIRLWSRVGLWGAAAMVILTTAFLYSPWRFYASSHTARWMTFAGTLLAVLAVAAVLLTVRKQVPHLRQTEGLQQKIQGYADYVHTVYSSMLAVVIMICLFTVFSGRNVLLMLALVCVLVLMLNFPNIYRIKTDLGLDDSEMHTLYGNQYIGGNAD